MRNNKFEQSHIKESFDHMKFLDDYQNPELLINNFLHEVFGNEADIALSIIYSSESL